MAGSCSHEPIPDQTGQTPEPMTKAYRVGSDDGESSIVFAETYADAVAKFCKHYDLHEDEVQLVHLMDDKAII